MIFMVMAALKGKKQLKSEVMVEVLATPGRAPLAWSTLLYIRHMDVRGNIVTMVTCKQIVMEHARASPNCHMGYL